MDSGGAMRWAFTLAMLTLGLASVRAQFNDTATEYMVMGSASSQGWGNGMSFVDFNLDGWDDLTVATAAGPVRFYTGGPDGFVEVDLGMYNDGDPKGVLWADMDGDGDRDFMVSNRFETNRFWRNVGPNMQMEEQTQAVGWGESANWDSFGLSLIDFNRDGWLDIYVANFDFVEEDGVVINALYQSEQGNEYLNLSFELGLGNQISPSFQATWFDQNGDGWKDFYLVNDRNEYNNALFINQMGQSFVNTGNDNFANIGISAMTSTVGDPDHDGEWELFCTDVENEASFLLDLDSTGVYVNRAASWGLETDRWGWAGMWMDYDADRQPDLFVATRSLLNDNPYANYLMHASVDGLSNGGVFEDSTVVWPHPTLGHYVLVNGDMNNDGRPDFAALGTSPFVQTLLNVPEGSSVLNHALTVDLCGTSTNTEAIGAVVKVHAGGVAQMQELRAGEDYLAQHSTTLFFGLGDAATADSIEVVWPSGVQEVFYDLPADSSHVFIELAGEFGFTLHGDLCDGGVAWVTYEAPQRTALVWGDGGSDGGAGLTQDSLILGSSGEYVVRAEWFGGLYTHLDTLTFVRMSVPLFSFELLQPACFSEAGALAWDAGNLLDLTLDGIGIGATPDSNALGLPLDPGAHVLQWTDSITGCAADSAFNIVMPEALLAQWLVLQPSCHGDSGQVWLVELQGGTPPIQLEGTMGFLQAGAHVFSLTDANMCSADTVFSLVDPPLLVVDAVVVDHPDATADIDLVIVGGTPPVTVMWGDGEEGASRYGLPPGLYAWVAEDALDCVVFGAELLTPTGLSEMSDGAWPPLPQVTDGRWCLTSREHWELGIFDALGRKIWPWDSMSAERYCRAIPAGPVLWIVRDAKTGRVARFWTAR
jgi:hypothetical protein